MGDTPPTIYDIVSKWTVTFDFGEVVVDRNVPSTTFLKIVSNPFRLPLSKTENILRILPLFETFIVPNSPHFG